MTEQETTAAIASLAQRGTPRKGLGKKAVQKQIDAAAKELAGAGIPKLFPSAIVLAGDSESVSTEDQWQTVSAGARQGARLAWVQFYIYGADGNAEGQIERRRSSGDQEILTAALTNSTGDAEADNSLAEVFVELTGAGTFDYKTTTTAGTVEWSIKTLGDWM